MTYVVTGEYITLTTATAQGPRLIGFIKGTLVPDDVPQEQIDHHLRKGLIAELEGKQVADPDGVDLDADPAAVEGEPADVVQPRVSVSADEPEPFEAPEQLEPEPAGNASEDTWRRFVLSNHLATEADLEGLTRNDLRDKYGSRG